MRLNVAKIRITSIGVVIRGEYRTAMIRLKRRHNKCANPLWTRFSRRLHSLPLRAMFCKTYPIAEFRYTLTSVQIGSDLCTARDKGDKMWYESERYPLREEVDPLGFGHG
jgi:hypothetical protein